MMLKTLNSLFSFSIFYTKIYVTKLEQFVDSNHLDILSSLFSKKDATELILQDLHDFQTFTVPKTNLNKNASKVC